MSGLIRYLSSSRHVGGENKSLPADASEGDTMRLKFVESYADADCGYKREQEYDFIDSRRASYFVAAGLALPVEDLPTPPAPPAKPPKGKKPHEMATGNAK